MKALPQLIREDWRDEKRGYGWVLWLGAVWLLWPATIAAVYWLASRTSGQWPLGDPEMKAFVTDHAVRLEVLGPILLMIAAVAYFVKAAFTRNLTYCVIGAIVAVLLFREVYWDVEDRVISKGMIFPVLGLAFAWLLLWRDLIDKPSENKIHTILFFGAVLLYACGQLVERRALKSVLPDEKRIHTAIEESCEIVAHLMLISAAVFGSWARRTITISKPKG
ncbi:MAG: hypothetical protein HN909_03140 [Phycisphaerales bacterium]|jgi:hypothetical protein|nr:hypothetical protein [Phycisphaerales bacterium]MBT7170746.1 hypothetical protein [Phycisphaerales bacterium]